MIDASQVKWDDEAPDPSKVKWDSSPTPSIMGPMAADAAAIKQFAASDPNANSIGKLLTGATDVGSTLASRVSPAAFIPQLAGGLSGLLALPQGTDAAADKVRQVEQSLSYEPQTPAGKVVAAAPDYVFNKIGHGADYLGQKTTDLTGSPLAGAGVSTAAQILPLLLGDRAIRGGIDTARAVRAADLTRGDQSIPASIDTDMHGITDRASLSDMLTKGATDPQAPTPADGLKSMLDQVKTTIAQNMNQQPNAPAPKPRGRLNLQTGKVEPVATENANAADRPVAVQPDNRGAGTGVDSAPVSPEAAARAAALEEKPDAAQPLHPWTPTDASASVPLAGGISDEATGPQVVIDKRIPQYVTVPDRNGKPVQIDAHEAIALHERTEHPIMHEDGADYSDAHDVATKAENAFVSKKYNVDPALYQKALTDAIAKAREEAPKEPGNIPANLYAKPYVDGGDEHLLTQEPVEQNVPQMKLPARKLSKKQMLDRGADGHLSTGYERYIPIEKLDGLEPVPAADTPSGKYDPGRKIEQPIEVKYDPENDSYMVYAGNHRTAQAVANGQKYIRAFVEETDGSIGKTERVDPDANVPATATSEPSVKPISETAKPISVSTPALDTQRLSELRQVRDAGTATPEQLHELSTLQDTAAHTADVGGELIPGVLNARGRAQLEASGKMKPVRVKTDLDDFKDINDTLGHDVGDQALKLKAEAMREAFGAGNVWREGGDEFGAHADTEEAAHAAMQQVRSKLAGARLERVDDSGNVLGSKPIKVSYGLGRGKTPLEAAKAADNALYADKNARKASGERTGRRSTDARSDVAGVGTGNEVQTPEREVSPSGSEEVAVAEPHGKHPETVAEAAPENPQGVSARNAAVDADRARYGLDELPAAEREHWDEPTGEALARIAKDPSYPTTLAREVAAKPRPLTTAETMALVVDLKRLDEEHEAATQAIVDAQNAGDTNAEVRATLQRQDVLDAINTNHDAVRNGGTEAARSLSIRNAILKDDYSLGRNMNRAKAAYGKEFNPELQKQIEELSAKLKEKDDLIASMERKKQVDVNTKMQAKLSRDIAAMEEKLAKRLKVCPV